jgi:type II secretory pathway component GspD/PulD (secretin)
MKTKLVTLLLVGLNAGLCIGFAQNNPASDGKDQKPNADAKPAADTAATAEPAGDVLPLVQFEDAPLVDVIKTLARQANLNVVFDPRVTAPGPDGKPTQPPVSIRLEKVTAENVLEAVLNNNNLRMEKDVKTKISRVTIKDPAAAEPLVTKIYQLKYTSPSNLVTIITPTISPRSRAIPDGRTSQLIMVATEKELLELDPLIEKLDTITKQVLIEARVYETSRNPNSVKGINWEGTFGGQNFSFGNNSQFQKGLEPKAPSLGTTTIDPVTGLATTSGASPEYPGALSGLLQEPKLLANTANGFNPGTAFLNADGVKGVLSWFNKDNQTELVSTPRTVTLDNQPAILNVTKAFPIYKVTSGGTQAGPTVDITYTNLGTILTVTPRISASSNVALKVVPEVSNLDSQDSQTINGLVTTANIYAIRRIETQVLIPSGNTLVMGGLMSDNISKGQTKVPVFGDLPGLGYLFRSSSKNRVKQSLILFITPTIVSDEDFQATPTDFLKKKPQADKPENDEGPFTNEILDSAQPHDWSKPVY